MSNIFRFLLRGVFFLYYFFIKIFTFYIILPTRKITNITTFL